MTSSSPEFIPIDQAAEDYPPSRRTIEREREKAREKGDIDTLNAFILKTKDGHEFPAPEKNLFRELSKDGRQPETFIRVDWLEKTFRQNKQQRDAPQRQEGSDSDADESQPDAPSSDPMMNAILNQLTEKDKQLAAKDQQIEQLTNTLRSASDAYKQGALTMHDLQQKITALPSGFVGSAVEMSEPLTPKPKKKTQSVDTTSKPEPVKQSRRTKNTSTKSKKATAKKSSPKAKATEKKSGFLSGLWNRN